MPAVLEMILDYLDHKGLSNVQKVCRLWNEVVNESLSWKKKFKDRVNSFVLLS